MKRFRVLAICAAAWCSVVQAHPLAGVVYVDQSWQLATEPDGYTSYGLPYFYLSTLEAGPLLLDVYTDTRWQNGSGVNLYACRWAFSSAHISWNDGNWVLMPDLSATHLDAVSLPDGVLTFTAGGQWYDVNAGWVDIDPLWTEYFDEGGYLGYGGTGTCLYPAGNPLCSVEQPECSGQRILTVGMQLRSIAHNYVPREVRFGAAQGVGGSVARGDWSHLPGVPPNCPECMIGAEFGTRYGVTCLIVPDAWVEGDLDGDGLCGLSDLAILLGHYGMWDGMWVPDPWGGAGVWIQLDLGYECGDLDGDGEVTLIDLAELLGLFNGG